MDLFKAGKVKSIGPIYGFIRHADCDYFFTKGDVFDQYIQVK